jgi:hypothetical protein
LNGGFPRFYKTDEIDRVFHEGKWHVLTSA